MSMLAAGAGAMALLLVFARRRGRRVRTRPVVVEPSAPAVDPPVEDIDPDRLAEIESLLAEFISDEPRPGFFYQVLEGDDLLSIAAVALDTVAPHSTQALMLYIYCLQSGPKWNMLLYGTGSTTLDFPKEWLVPGKNTGVRVAFRPRNEDAHALMLQGVMPKMAVNPAGGEPLPGNAGSYGLLWFPPVDAESLASGEPTCAPFSWDDGSSTIDPPPQLLDLLEAA